MRHSLCCSATCDHYFQNLRMHAGASDCASCCGVLLELARTVIADRSLHLPAPLVFLLNGGEETFLQVLLCHRTINPEHVDEAQCS